MATSFRKYSIPVLALAFIALGCDGSPSAPEGALFGRWGGEGIELLAGPNGVRVTNGCAGLEAEQPLVPDGDGRFLIADVQSIGHWPFLGAITLRGVVSGPEIAFETVVAADTTYVSAYTVTKGRKAELAHYCALALQGSS